MLNESGPLPLERLLSGTQFERPDGVDAILKSVRKHMGMDVAFVAEFGEEDRLIRHMDAGAKSPIAQGDRISLEVGYCQRVVDGRLPELIVDACALPAAAALPETQAIPIGSHLSVPIRLRDGQVYGTFCCFSYVPDLSIGQRDLRVMRAFAEVLGDQISRQRELARDEAARSEAILRAMDSGDPTMVYQPIYDLLNRRMIAAECLARFRSEPVRPPDVWFGEAARVGLGPSLEAAAIRSALRALPLLPSDIELAVNVSPEAICSGMLAPIVQATDARRVILEITEHAAVLDYGRLTAELAPLRALGLRIAIDDAGAGYSGLNHILAVEPDMVKLDISLTRGIDRDRRRRALATSLIAFAKEISVDIIAEGVETHAELQTLAQLGVRRAQGYFLGRPMPFEELLRSRQLDLTSARREQQAAPAPRASEAAR